MEIRPLTRADTAWVLNVWQWCEQHLGSMDVTGKIVWHRWLVGRNPREHFIGIEGLAFAHYLVRARDGGRTLYNVGVHPRARRQGLGRALLNAAGYPMRLKTNEDNVASQAFYRALGFEPDGHATTRDGRLMLCFQKVAP